MRNGEDKCFSRVTSRQLLEGAEGEKGKGPITTGRMCRGGAIPRMWQDSVGSSDSLRKAPQHAATRRNTNTEYTSQGRAQPSLLSPTPTQIFSAVPATGIRRAFWRLHFWKSSHIGMMTARALYPRAGANHWLTQLMWIINIQQHPVTARSRWVRAG